VLLATVERALPQRRIVAASKAAPPRAVGNESSGSEAV